jgi:hypothetical protein
LQVKELTLRRIPLLLFVILLLIPRAARSQSIELYGSAGPTITDEGNSVAAGVGFPLHSRLTLLASLERTHLSSTMTRDGDVFSYFRGGTLVLGNAELRVFPFGRGRVGPYGLGGLAAGRSRPNVNEIFPHPVTNDVLAMFIGGGLLVPIGDRLSAFADARMQFGAEGTEGIVAVAPIRAGLSWRF